MLKLFFNYVIAIFMLHFLYVNGENDISNTFFKFDSCEAYSTFPNIGDNGLPQYGADNALTRGSGYWCSEGKHNPNDVISWIGHLKNVRSLNGVIIHWAYSPGEVSIMASYDGNDPYEEVVPYQAIESRAGNIIQNIIFNHVIRAKSIKINMRHPVHEYFGINFVNVLGSRDPTLRIQGGMSSLTQDLCLQINETNDVVLGGCINSMSYLDGRDLWKLNSSNQIYNPINNLCMSLKNNMIANGGELIMEDCNSSLEHNDGRSSWQLLPNNQLKILRDGNFCLTQDGSKSGSIDIALHKQATSSLSRKDQKYSPEKAIDGNLDTFWLSEPFDIETVPDAVYFDINLGGKYKLEKSIIYWKYPATKYSIFLSNDGENYKEISSNLANFLRSTINDLHITEAQYIRIKLMSPNPEFSEGDEENLFYGIKKVSIYTNRIKSIVDDCDKVKDSDDARDKYFFEFVSEVNIEEGKELKNIDTTLQKYAEKIQTEAIKIQKLNPQLKKCKSNKEKRHTDIINIKNVILKNIYDVINKTENILKSNTFNLYYSTSTSELGQTPDNPAYSCFHLKGILPSSPSGFYYVLPTCSQNVLRVFCDMKIGSMYYIPSIDTNIINKIKDVENICASYGLNPIHLNDQSQVYTLKNLFHLMNININNPVPLAIIKNDVENYFYSLDFQENVDNIISKFGTPIGNTFGINNTGVIFFDSFNSEMSGFVCSDNINSINPPPPFINLNCDTTLKQAIEIEKFVGNEYLFKCPYDCLKRNTEATVIGGEGNIYSEDSSICLSSIHAGVYDKHYLINLRVLNALGEYEGVYQNGIISDSYINDSQEVAFKVFRVPPKCPNNTANFESFSFLQTTPISIGNIDKTATIENNNHPLIENFYIDSSTADAINDLVTVVNKKVGSSDPTFLALINNQVITIVSNARRYLKPTENFEKNIELLSNETLKDVQKISHTIKLLSSRITSELDKIKYKLEGLINERLRQIEFESWGLENVVDSDIYNTFEIVNMLDAHLSSTGGGKWNLLDKPLEEGMSGKVLTQNARIHDNISDSNSLFYGTYAFLRYKLFYDFVFSTYVHVKGTGSVGIIFRAYDKYNYYMLELNNSINGYKRLLKFENNEPTELAIINDAGFDENMWFGIRIECAHSKIKISIIKTNKPLYDIPNPDIVVNDDFNSAGTIGFYTYGIDSVEFAKSVVESVECLTKENYVKNKNNIPLICNIYEEFYVGKFNKSYLSFDEANENKELSNWNYANNIGNEKRVILCTSDAYGKKKQKEEYSYQNNDSPSSYIILQKKICSAGVFNFSVYPQCKNNGTVGAIIKFLDPNNYTILDIGPNFTRLRQNINGNFHLLGESIVSGYKANNWNIITISFSSTNVNVNMGNGLTTYPIFSLIGLDLFKGEQIGLASYNCNNVSFSNIFIHPFDFKPYSPTPSVGIESMVPIFSKIRQDTIHSEVLENDKSLDYNMDNHKRGELEEAEENFNTKHTEIEKHSFHLNQDKIDNENKQNDIYYCATHKDIASREAFCNKHNIEDNNCTNNFCKSCCDNIQVEMNEEDTNTCIKSCEKLDQTVLETSEILNFLKNSCIESSNEELKKTCEHDDDIDQCVTDMCQMCCQSIIIPENLLTSNIKLNPLINQCISECE
ncbi:LCCL domain-containing protein [Plasmodium berghei]|uniref:LCCL domain-containing protein n=3 Tax=Plasmodium berghei TaxID=5821 RepID=A0A509AWE4_PLABA|nr:LCCL domain-containing protein [Plasmodium berghei ANKA]SCL96670.1 LCCL domain-containing protein [Plasmodium berghei]SCM16470.1 LCCL domain-containing protein [Plasmodium berghei]SCM18264.1 LCCL domain-containing protein [Plasmodium berghei]SCN27692.1 LCCL domain-containing protein [Plasmodium berghei]VUC57576.1 LCCL domain-containing protein [Plasmodium berghei ANKA]|eukprot:XP_034423347.1 LCCL domain-containing protein [Plasmodium berghei ANKA]